MTQTAPREEGRVLAERVAVADCERARRRLGDDADARGHEHHQLPALLEDFLLLEQPADDRDVAGSFFLASSAFRVADRLSQSANQGAIVATTACTQATLPPAVWLEPEPAASARRQEQAEDRPLPHSPRLLPLLPPPV